MLSFKPQKTNAVIVSKNPAYLLEYSNSGKRFKLGFSLYIDPLEIIKNDIANISITLVSRAHSRPPIFDGIDDLGVDLERNVKKRISDVKIAELKHKQRQVFANTTINLFSAITGNLRKAITDYYDGIGTIEKIYEQMPDVTYYTEKINNKIKNGEKVIYPYPYDSSNQAIEYLTKNELKKLYRKESIINDLVNNANNKGIPLSEIGNFAFPLSDQIKNGRDFSVKKIGDILNAKFTDVGITNNLQSQLGDETPIDELYRYFVELSYQGDLTKFIVEEDRTWTKIPLMATIYGDLEKSLNGNIEAVFKLRTSNGGVRERFVVPVEIESLLSSFNYIRIPPYISVAKLENNAEIFVKQRDPNGKAIKILKKLPSGEYKDITTVGLLYGEETTINDPTYVDSGDCKSIVYRALVIDKNNSITPVFNDTTLICKSVDNIGSNLDVHNGIASCKLTNVGLAGDMGKYLIKGIINVIEPPNSLYSVYRTLLTNNGSKLGERTIIPIKAPGNLLLDDATSLQSFEFSDEVASGIWLYEIEAYNPCFGGVIHSCEIIVSELIQKTDETIKVVGETTTTTIKIMDTTYVKDGENFIVTSLIALNDSTNTYVNVNDSRINFSLNSDGNNVTFEIVGSNTYEQIDENNLKIISTLQVSNIRTALETSIGSKVTETQLKSFIVSSQKTHIIPIGVN